MSDGTYTFIGVFSAAGIVALASYLASRRSDAATAATQANIVGETGLVEDVHQAARRIAASIAPTHRPIWAAPVQYAGVIVAAEGVNAIPKNLLARLLYQESKYRSDIISGEVVSSAGAVGIAQIVPKWHPKVNPRDPIASIWYAAEYLRKLYELFEKDWRKALAAYNWGPGNLQKINLRIPLWLSQCPTETRNYVEQITKDVPV